MDNFPASMAILLERGTLPMIFGIGLVFFVLNAIYVCIYIYMRGMHISIVQKSNVVDFEGNEEYKDIILF